MDDGKPVSQTLRDRIEQALNAEALVCDSTGDLLPEAIDTVHEAVSAGADFTPPDEGTERSPAQALAFLLDADPDTRLAQLAGLLGSATRGAQCFLVDHQGRIEFLTEQLAEIPEPVRRRYRMQAEAQQFLRQHGVTLTDQQWAQVRERIEIENPL